MGELRTAGCQEPLQGHLDHQLLAPAGTPRPSAPTPTVRGEWPATSLCRPYLAGGRAAHTSTRPVTLGQQEAARYADSQEYVGSV